MKHILNTMQFTKKDTEKILASAARMEKASRGKGKAPLAGKIVASIFFEPSTRTRLSFESAALRLGAEVISVENAAANSSAFKGESIEDTTRTLSAYADLIVMRHSEMGAVQKAATAARVPVVNAGDGANQHPSQGFLDLYTIKKELGRLANLKIAFVGDVLNSRTLRSLVPLMLHYPGNTFYFVSPAELVMEKAYREFLKKKKARFVETNSLENVLPEVDVLYMTRVQKERFKDKKSYEKVKDAFLLKPSHVKKMKKKSIIMHPLPRVNEVDPGIDADPRAAYFRQVENGLYVRMALLAYAMSR